MIGTPKIVVGRGVIVVVIITLIIINGKFVLSSCYVSGVVLSA